MEETMHSTKARHRTTKLPVDPNRIRHMPTQFAPIDRRLVYDRHTCRLTHQQMALYLFLQCVGDAAGLSYYSDERICQYLHFTGSELRDARQGLIQRHFLLYRRPIYQLLDLPQPASVPSIAASPSIREEPPGTRGAGEAVAIGAVVSSLCVKGSSS
jgi:hypothetical protein